MKGLPCLVCNKLNTGYILINLHKLKKTKQMKCWHCGSWNMLSAEDSKRIVDINMTNHIYIKKKEFVKDEQHMFKLRVLR